MFILSSEASLDGFDERILTDAHRGLMAVIDQYLADGNNPDQPGRLIQWLYPRMPVYTWSVPGTWYDIGSKETLEEADGIFSANHA